MTRPAMTRSGIPGGVPEGSQTLIHRSKVSNPHGSSLSGPLDPEKTGLYSAISPVSGERVFLPVGSYFDKAGQLRRRTDAKSTP